MFQSYISNLCRPLEALGQETLKLDAELGNIQGLVEDFKKSKDEINSIEMENKFVLKKDVYAAYMSKVEWEPHLNELTKINSL